MTGRKTILAALCLLFFHGPASAQGPGDSARMQRINQAQAELIGKAMSLPGRKYVRSGNRDYERGNYVESEVGYRRALETAPSPEGAYNLAGALYKQEKFDEAAQIYAGVANMGKAAGEQLPAQYKDMAANSFYGDGNALFKQRKLQEALEAYKDALRINPGDQQAKFNLAYTKKLLENNKQDKDKDKDKDDQDQQQQQQQQQQPQGGQEKKPQPGQSHMTPEEAQQMLEAMQESEDRTREKVNEAQRAKGIRKSDKNW